MLAALLHFTYFLPVYISSFNHSLLLKFLSGMTGSQPTLLLQRLNMHLKLLSNQVNATVQQVIWGFLIQSQKCILLHLTVVDPVIPIKGPTLECFFLVHFLPKETAHLQVLKVPRLSRCPGLHKKGEVYFVNLG